MKSEHLSEANDIVAEVESLRKNPTFPLDHVRLTYGENEGYGGHTRYFSKGDPRAPDSLFEAVNEAFVRWSLARLAELRHRAAEIGLELKEDASHD